MREKKKPLFGREDNKERNKEDVVGARPVHKWALEQRLELTKQEISFTSTTARYGDNVTSPLALTKRGSSKP